jgi:hypothetical protein
LKIFPIIFLDLTDFCWEADFVYNRDVGSSFNYKQKTQFSLLKNKLTFVVVSGLQLFGLARQTVYVKFVQATFLVMIGWRAIVKCRKNRSKSRAIFYFPSKSHSISNFKSFFFWLELSCLVVDKMILHNFVSFSGIMIFLQTILTTIWKDNSRKNII